jgi:peptidoglycan/LPS O-acetylase OafA/YrhL
MTEKKLNYVDALRGIAILGVLVVHCGQSGTNNYAAFVQNILVNGALGVQLFYVASAFTIFLTFGSRQGKELNPGANFFIRRFFRIAPMYYLGILYYLFQDGWGPRYWLGDAPGISSWNVLSNIFFIHGFNPYWITSVVPGGWSIAVEMSFYSLVPLLFMQIRNLNQSVVFFILTLLVRMILQVILQRFPLITPGHLWDEYLFFYLANQLPVFACGIILYFLITTPRRDWQVDLVVLFTISLLVLAQLTAHTVFIFPVHVQFGMAFVFLGYVLSRNEFYVLVNPLTIYIGKISYSMYLVHFAVLHGLSRFNLLDLAPGFPATNFGLRLFCLTAITSLIATIFYHLIEVPFQELGKRIIRRREDLHRASLGLA